MNEPSRGASGEVCVVTRSTLVSATQMATSVAWARVPMFERRLWSYRGASRCHV